MVSGALLYLVPQLETRYRSRSVNNLSVSDSFEVVSRRNYLIEHIQVKNSEYRKQVILHPGKYLHGMRDKMSKIQNILCDEWQMATLSSTGQIRNMQYLVISFIDTQLTQTRNIASLSFSLSLLSLSLSLSLSTMNAHNRGNKIILF